MKFLSLWTWLIVRAMGLLGAFPKGHAWRDKKFSLAEWDAGQTSIGRQFNVAFWGWFCAVIFLAWRFW